MAERLFKKIIKDRKIKGLKASSRGINAKNENISENAKIVLKEYGASDRDRKSIQLGKIDPGTLYVAMTDKIKGKINGRVISMNDLLGSDVLDPFMQDLDVYRETARELVNGIDILLSKILNVRSK